MLPQIPQLEIITDVKKLRQKARKVSKWSGVRTGTKMIKFVAWNEISCLGLAAPQVGIDKRVFILFDGNEFAIFVNPRIIEVGALESEEIEQCLSIPGASYKVRRPTSIVVKDAVRTKPFELTGWTARAWLHEFDHLSGKLICDIGEKVDEVSPQQPI